MTEEEEKTYKDSNEINALVISIRNEMRNLLFERTAHINQSQRFLIQGRVANLVFAGFYNPIIVHGENVQEKLKQELGI